MSDRFPPLPPEPDDDEAGEPSPFELLMAEAGDALQLPEPTFWPDIPLADLAGELDALRAWVEGLVRRYPHLDVHFIPPCWYRHPSHVEALAALRDHERVSFSPASPATSPAQWQTMFAQIEARLRLYTDAAGCLSTHREQVCPLVPPSDDEWAEFVAGEVAARRADLLHKAAAAEIGSRLPSPATEEIKEDP